MWGRALLSLEAARLRLCSAQVRRSPARGRRRSQGSRAAPYGIAVNMVLLAMILTSGEAEDLTGERIVATDFDA